MKLYFYVFIFIAISCNINRATNTPKSQLGSSASIEWRDTTVDLGNVRLGSTKKIAFYYKNSGRDSIQFEKVEATCSCTLLDKSIGKTLLPGFSDSITASIHFKDEVGPVESKIYVLSNGIKQFQVLKIIANVTQ